MVKNLRAPSLPRLEKDAFVTQTNLSLVSFGDFLLAAESNLQRCKESGVRAISELYGPGGNIKPGEAKRFSTAHRKRYDRDMAKVLRYAAAVGLDILLETTARKFIADFDTTYPGKRPFRQGELDFLVCFRRWSETPPTPVHLSHPRIWALLDDFRVIRNCIVHVNGDLSIEEKPTRIAKCEEVVRRTRKVRFDARSTLILDAEFAFEVLDRVVVFFGLLFRETGYGLALPASYVGSFSKSFADFEEETAEGIEACYPRQTMNLGGAL